MRYHYSLGQLRALSDSLAHVAANLIDDWCEALTDSVPWTDEQIAHIEKAVKRLHDMLTEVVMLLQEGHKL